MSASRAAMDVSHLAQCFEDGRVVGDATIHLKHLGDLHVPTGAMVACDPLVSPDAEPFVTRVPPGRYAVTVAVARFPSGDERVAVARIEIFRAPVARWEMALLPEQDASTLEADEFYGYPVDAGLGCFMDQETGRLLLQRMDQLAQQPRFVSYYDDVLSQRLDTNYRDTWTWLNHHPLNDRPHNTILFSSGVGDGIYPSYWGVDPDGQPCYLITDFGVLDFG